MPFSTPCNSPSTRTNATSAKLKRGSTFWAIGSGRKSYCNLLYKASPGYLNALAVFMRKEPTHIGSGSTFNAGSLGYTAVFKARLLKTGSTRYGTMSINN